MRLLCMPTGLSDSETNIRTSARFYSLLAIATDVAVADPGIGGGDDLCSPFVPSLPSLFCPSLPQSGPLKSSYKIWGDAVSSPCGPWWSPVFKRFYAF